MEKMSWEERRRKRSVPSWLHNRLVIQKRLFKSWINTREKIPDCIGCAEPVWQYPEPKYWMEFPLPEYLIIDGHPVCSEYCLGQYYDKHPHKKGEQLSLFQSNTNNNDTT
jgi:hypothetical protein